MSRLPATLTAIALALAVALPASSQAQVFTDRQSGQIARNRAEAQAAAGAEAAAMAKHEGRNPPYCEKVATGRISTAPESSTKPCGRRPT